MEKVLGVDVGGVILVGERGAKDTVFQGDHLKSPSADYVFDALRQLRERVFGERIHIVSKCGPNVQRKTTEWLDHHQFYDRAGISRKNVHFCLERAQKAPICKKYGITTFIDDSLEVLGYLHEAGVPNLLLFNPDYRREGRFERYRPHVQLVSNWREVLSKLSAA